MTPPGWDGIDAVIEDCLQSMWDEGPGEDFERHGHYTTMSSTAYTRVACGFAETSEGRIWSNQNFQ